MDLWGFVTRLNGLKKRNNKENDTVEEQADAEQKKNDYAKALKEKGTNFVLVSYPAKGVWSSDEVPAYGKITFLRKSVHNSWTLQQKQRLCNRKTSVLWTYRHSAYTVRLQKNQRVIIVRLKIKNFM